MPIRYTCVGCREDLLLPDAKAGQLCSCPFCRLKFLAPARSAGGPVQGSVAPPASQLPRREPPPLYPVDRGQPKAQPRTSASPVASEHSLAPVEADEVEPEGGAMFGGLDRPLFGETDVELGELFGGAAKPPAAPDADELEIPDFDIEPTPLSAAAPETDAPLSLVEDDRGEAQQPSQAPATPEPARGDTGTNRLVAVDGLPQGTVFDLPPGKVHLIGRDKQAEIKILSTSVSRKQARIDTTAGRPVLIDLGSANGTRVNGEAVDRHPLVNGDLIKMGVVTFRYEGE